MRIDQKRKVKIDGCQKQISRMMDAQNGSKEMQTRTRQEQQEQNAKGQDTTVGVGALSSDTKMMQAENQPRPRFDQRFKNSDWTDRTDGYGRLGGCDGEGNGRSGS